MCFTYIISLFMISFYYLLYYTRYTDSNSTMLSCMKCLVSRCVTQEPSSSHESFLRQLITSLISLTQLNRWDIYISTPLQAGWKIYCGGYISLKKFQSEGSQVPWQLLRHKWKLSLRCLYYHNNNMRNFLLETANF